MRRFGAFLLISLLLAESRAIARDCGNDPTLIIPGICVGRITAETRYSDLRTLFPGYRVAAAIYWDDGGEQCATILDPARPTERLILWSRDQNWEGDQRPGSKLEETCRGFDFGSANAQTVIIPASGWGRLIGHDGKIHPTYDGPASFWHTTEGIRIGTPIRTLGKLLSHPVTVSGIGWDYSGAAFIGEFLTVGTSLGSTGLDHLSDEEKQSITGDKQIDIDNPIVKKLDPVILDFVVTLTAANTAGAAGRSDEPKTDLPKPDR